MNNQTIAVKFDPIVELDVGGQVFKTFTSTISKIPGSLLARMLDPSQGLPIIKDTNGRIFFDRNPKYFERIIEYYRSGILIHDDIPPEWVETELNFWGIPFEKEEVPEEKPEEKQESPGLVSKYLSKTKTVKAFFPNAQFSSKDLGLTMTLVDDHQNQLVLENCVEICGVVVTVKKDIWCPDIVLGIFDPYDYENSDSEDDEDDKTLERLRCITKDLPEKKLSIGDGEQYQIECNIKTMDREFKPLDIKPCFTLLSLPHKNSKYEFVFIYKTSE